MTKLSCAGWTIICGHSKWRGETRTGPLLSSWETNQWREADVWPPASRELPTILTDKPGRSRQEPSAKTHPRELIHLFPIPAQPVVNPYDNSREPTTIVTLRSAHDVLTFDSAPTGS